MLPAAAQTRSADASRVQVVVAMLDSDGDVVSAQVNDFRRTYTGDGSSDKASTQVLEVTDGLLKTSAGMRALPIVVRMHAFLDGKEVKASELKGKSGDVRVEWTVTNRSERTQDVTYTDSATGTSRTVTAATALPMTVSFSGIHLPDANFDSIKTNGVASHANGGTDLSWTSVLAPPLFPGSATFSYEGKTAGFKMSAADLTATPGMSGAIPAAVRDATDKGGASTATLLGYVKKFGGGFGDLGSGLGQIKGGVDQVLDGINGKLKPGLQAPNFDRAKYNEDSTLADNQPGLVQGLGILADGLGTLKEGVGKVRVGLKSGDAAHPGVSEGLSLIGSSIGAGNEFDSAGNPLTLRATLNAMRAGLVSGNAASPKILEGLQAVSAAIGAGTEFDAAGNPLTLRASINAIRKGISSGDALAPGIIEGLEQIYSSIGTGTEFTGTTPLTLAAGLAAARGALSSGDAANPKIIEGLQQIYGSIGTGTEFAGTTPLTLAASLAAARAALSSGDAANPKIIEGLQMVYDGIGTGTEFSGTTPLTVQASLKAMRLALQSGNPAAPGIIEGVQKVFAGIGDGTEFSGTTPLTVAASLAALDTNLIPLLQGNLQANLGALGLLTVPQQSVIQGVIHGAIGTGTAPSEFDAAGNPLTIRASLNVLRGALSSGNIANPRILEGLQKVYAGIGNGTEFSGATPLSVAASLVAMRGALSSGNPLNPKIIEGLKQIYDGIGAGNEFSGTTPLTIRAGLTAIRAGLVSGDVNNPRIIEGLQQIYGAIGVGNEFSGSTPLSLRAGLNAIRAGLKSGNAADPKIVEGLAKIRAGLGDGSEFSGATPLTLQAGLVAIQQGSAQLAGGVQLIHDGIGDGTEVDANGKPKSLQAGLVAMGSGANTLSDGINQIVAGLGSLQADGHAKKEVTQRITKAGNKVEDPATALWAIESAQSAVNDKFVDGVNQILEALGDPNVSKATILYGLSQLSAGLATAATGATGGAAGAGTLSGVLGSTAAAQDVASGLQQAGASRAETFSAFTDQRDPRVEGRVVFILRMGAIG
jgi:putative membrane protein